MKLLRCGAFSLVFVIASSLAGMLSLSADNAGPHGVWLGQDGQDFVGPSSTPGPSDVQDIHLRLTGLPVDEEIASATFDRLGGGQWVSSGPWGPWRAHVEQPRRAATADVYLEPSHADTPALHVTLHFGDGKTSEFDMPGGYADINLRMPGAKLIARWLGQDGPDWTGAGPAVGPDGRQDVHLVLSGLSARIAVKSLTATSPGPVTWQYGLNPERDGNAEIVPNAADPARADLFLTPAQDMRGETLTLKIVYANDKTDQATVACGPCDPARLVPAPVAPLLRPSRITARWLGQDSMDAASRQDDERRGDIHVTLAHLPAGQSITEAALSDPTGGYWVNPPIQDAAPLTMHLAGDGQTADLLFPAYRDEADAVLTLRLTLGDGTLRVVQFPGGPCDPFRRGSMPAPTQAVAHPGDDLQAMVGRFGHLTLTAGTYLLRHPLILDMPITIRGAHGAVVRFSQSSDEPVPWSTAVELRRSNTTLAGFAICFAGPVRWSGEGNPAVIGTAPGGQGARDPRFNLVITGMDVEGPPVPGPFRPAALTPSPFLLRLGDAASGRIVGNLLRGGTTDVNGGPWRITDNTYLGAVPGTMAWDVFGGHYLHDLVVARNILSPRPGSGKTWRFLVLTQWGMRDRVLDNVIHGIGIQDGDGVPNPNAPEIFLTEAYRLHYEGTARWVSAAGRILQIPTVMNGMVRPGTVAAVLTGPHAGEWFRVAQPITPTTFLMERPLPPGDYAISLATGFVEETYAGNMIDNRGGSSVPLDLAGTHFGTSILNNHILGGSEGIRMASTPTERPGIWGWSHVPFLDVTVAGNRVEDSRRSVDLDVDDNQYNKTTAGRVYVRCMVRDNTVRWTRTFLRHWRESGAKPLPALVLGDRTRLSPSEFLLSVSGNVLQVPPGFRPTQALWIKAAKVNGQDRQDQRLPLPVRSLAAPSTQVKRSSR